MSKMPELPTYEFTVFTQMGSAAPQEHTVLASYFQESGRYTMLKDDIHVVVAAFRTDLVTTIWRSGDPVDDA